MSKKLYREIRLKKRDSQTKEWHDDTVHDSEVWITLRDENKNYRAMILVNFADNVISAIYDRGIIEYEAVHQKLGDTKNGNNKNDG